MRSVWAAAFLLRRWRSDVGTLVLIFVLVGSTAFLLATAPRLFGLVADEGLRHEISSAGVVERSIAVSLRGEPPAGTDPLGRLAAAGGSFLDLMPADIRSMIKSTDLVITSIQFLVLNAQSPTYGTTWLRLRQQAGLGDAIEIVDGRMPVARGEPLPAPRYGLGGGETPAEPARFEIAISDQTSQDTGLELGEVLDIQADPSDPLLTRSFTTPLLAEVQIVGIFHVTDTHADVWYDNQSLEFINVVGTDNPIAFAVGLVADDAFNDLAASGIPFAYEWHFPTQTDQVRSDAAPGLLEDLQRLGTLFRTSTTLGAFRQPVLRTGLDDLIRGYNAKRSSSEAVLSVAAIGPLFLAGGAVAMVGVLLAARRRPSLALTRGRGASSILIVAAGMWEGSILAGGASLTGLGMATYFTPGRGQPLSVLLVLALALTASAAFVAATWSNASRPLSGLHAEERPRTVPSPRRLVLEGTLVGLAGAGVVLLTQRGIVIDSGELTRFDPLLAATPALAGLAFGIVAMRLYPFPVKSLGWLAARRRDLVPVLGLRTVGRHPATANLPLLVLMLTAAFGAFASTVTYTVDRGQVVASYENLGADYRIDRIDHAPVSRVEPIELPGIQAVAGEYADAAATFSATESQRNSVLFRAIEPAAYSDVLTGTPIGLDLPAALYERTADAPRGTPDSPIPAVLSRRLPPGTGHMGRGDMFTVAVGGEELTFAVVATATEFPGVPSDSVFVVASYDQVRAAQSGPEIDHNVLMIRADAEVEPALRSLLRDELPVAQVRSRYEEYRTLADAPLVRVIVVGFAAALLVAAAYTALTVIAAMTLSAAGRTRDFAYLRTLGLTRRQALQLTVMEHGPPLLLALIPGVALGVGLAEILGPSLGLAAFAGSDRELTVAADWTQIAVIAGALLTVVAGAIAVSTWLSRRASAADALRIGDD